MGGCSTETRLILASQTGYLGFVSDGVGCAHIDPRVHTYAANLQPGRYRLIAVNDGPARASVTLDVSVIDPRCGNGIFESLNSEMCDDGNLIEDDGCSSMCLRTLGGTVTGPGSPPATFSGDIATPGDTVSYALVLTEGANLFAEVGVPTIGSCVGSDPVLDLFDVNGLFVTSNDDFQGSLCSHIDAVFDPAARLPAGTYELVVRTFGFESMIYELRVELRAMGCGNFIPELGEQCDDGNVAAGDGCSETCQFEP
jgi:cysteine-rich repeat protein